MSETFAFLTKAKKKSGKPDMMFWCSATNERIARSKLSIALDAAGLDEADYFNPQRTHLPVVDDLPPEDVLSSDFCRHYQMEDNNWVRRQEPLPPQRQRRRQANHSRHRHPQNPKNRHLQSPTIPRSASGSCRLSSVRRWYNSMAHATITSTICPPPSKFSMPKARSTPATTIWRSPSENAANWHSRMPPGWMR
ncbi:hypothetical protein MAY82_17115 [Edwardsiella ictaluri]|nr:RecE family exodeoxyribonuclease [Edwardsiella ictaluri]WFO12682.1 hypothetical protein MAY82_17115 [Edwardsiella ictaluri]